MNRLDTYSKLLLTIIAVGVAWICVSRERFVADAGAQPPSTPTTMPSTAEQQKRSAETLLLQRLHAWMRFKKRAATPTTSPTTTGANDADSVMEELEAELRQLLRQSAQRVLVAKEFVLVDDDGNPRATLDLLGLRIYDQNGNTRVDVHGLGDVGGIALNDAEGQERFRVDYWSKLADLKLVSGEKQEISMHTGTAAMMTVQNSDSLVYLTAGDEGSILGLSDGKNLISATTEPSISLCASGKTRAVLGARTVKDPRTGKSATTPSSFFTLMDEDGNERLSLFHAQGKPGMELLDKHGARRIGLNLFQDESASLFISAKDGKSTVLARADGATAALTLSDSEKVRAILHVQEAEHDCSLNFFDHNGKLRLDIGYDDTTTGLTLRDTTQSPRLAIDVLNDTPIVSLYGERGKGGISARVQAGEPGISLHDSSDRTRAVLGVANLETTRTGASSKTAPSSLTLFDKEGEVMWKAP